MLKFRSDTSSYVAVRHAMHIFPQFVKNTRSDVFDSYIGRTRSETQRRERTGFVARVADLSDEYVAQFEQKVEDLGYRLNTGTFDSPKLAVMRFQQIQVETATQLWDQLSRLARDEDQRELLVTYVARVQAFDAASFLEESIAARTDRLAAMAEGEATLSTWAQVFRDDEIREKNIRLGIYEAASYDHAVAAVEDAVPEIQECADNGEEWPFFEKMADDVARRALDYYNNEVLVPRMIGLVNANLVPNADAVALSATAPKVAEKAVPRLHKKVAEDVLEAAIVPMVRTVYENRVRENEARAEEGE